MKAYTGVLRQKANAKLLWGNLIHFTNFTMVGEKNVLQLSEIAKNSDIFSVPIKDWQSNENCVQKLVNGFL